MPTDFKSGSFFCVMCYVFSVYVFSVQLAYYHQLNNDELTCCILTSHLLVICKPYTERKLMTTFNCIFHLPTQIKKRRGTVERKSKNEWMEEVAASIEDTS